jgi:hypothetical protein
VSRVDPDGIVMSQQCTGRRYLEMLQRSSDQTLRYTDRASRNRIADLASRIISEFYDFWGYDGFANMVDNEIAKRSGADVTKWIQDTFDNRLIIVDEAHNLRETTDTTATTTVNDTVLAEIETLKQELHAATTTINTLRSDLNEVNLLNAKLLYTNKIFKEKTLNESQKVKVLSSFDKATTVKEVKLVYSTLNEGLKVKTTPIRENLGRASKSTNTPVVNTKQPIVESNAVFDRMRKLAGLI